MAIPRYLYERYHPEEVVASSGMWAFGDLMIVAFLFLMTMVPTIFLLRLLAKSEASYNTYAKVLLGVAVTAPVCIAVLALLQHPDQNLVGYTCQWRVVLAPFVIVALAVSRIAARFRLSKRLLSFALLTETLSFVLVIALFLGHGPSGGVR